MKSLKCFMKSVKTDTDIHDRHQYVIIHDSECIHSTETAKIVNLSANEVRELLGKRFSYETSVHFIGGEVEIDLNCLQGMTSEKVFENHLKDSDGDIDCLLLRSNAQLPKKATPDCAGYDLFFAASWRNDNTGEVYPRTGSIDIPPHSRILLETGLSMAIPKGKYGRIASRSGLAVKGIDACAGVIDASFRGEIKVLLHNTTDRPISINTGDRIAQIIIETCGDYTMKSVSSLSQTTRGAGGFGSTGN